MNTDIETGTHLDKIHTCFSHRVLARPLTIAFAAVRSKAPTAVPEIKVCICSVIPFSVRPLSEVVFCNEMIALYLFEG